MRLLSATALLPALTTAENLWTVTNTQMSLGPLSITFEDAPNVARVEQPNVYYDNRGVYDNAPSPGESIEKYLFLDNSDKVIFRFTVYNDYIFHVQTSSKNVEISMSHSEIGDCTTRLIGDKIFDLTRAKFKCGQMNWASNFLCDGITAGIHKRNGGTDNVKIENWISLDISEMEMDVEHTAACADSGWAVEDVYDCEYEADYYTNIWQLRDEPKVCSSYEAYE